MSCSRDVECEYPPAAMMMSKALALVLVVFVRVFLRERRSLLPEGMVDITWDRGMMLKRQSLGLGVSTRWAYRFSYSVSMVWREIFGWLGVEVEVEVLIRRGRSSGGYWLVVAPGRQLSMMSCVLSLLLEIAVIAKETGDETYKDVLSSGRNVESEMNIVALTRCKAPALCKCSRISAPS